MYNILAPYRICIIIILILCNDLSDQFRFQNRMSADNSNRKCKCVKSHLCSDQTISSIDDGLFDIRFTDDTCPNYYDICCDITHLNEQQSHTYPICGIQNTITSRITSNSEQTQFGELPWTVLVLQRDRNKQERNAFICGGSLIHPQVVITAAHCIQDGGVRRIKIRAGEWNLKNTNEPLPHQDSNVEDVIIHPSYRSGALWNDIALLFLHEPLIMARNIGFICLPPSNYNLETSQCIASGWGKSAPNKGRHSLILRKVTVPLVPSNQCTVALRNTRLGKFYKLHRSFICAGGEKRKDACKGDGGSPLICPIPGRNGRFFQIGIVSWGIGCGANRTPGVYVNVPIFVDWIDEMLRLKNLNTSYYKF